MDSRFESELAKRVAEKRGRRPGKKAYALVAALAVSVMMVASAVVSFAESLEESAPDWSNQPTMDSGVILDQFEDYVLGDGDSVALKRTMTLKYKTMETSGEGHPSYTALTYIVSFSVNGPMGAEILTTSTPGSLSLTMDGASSEDPDEGVVAGSWTLVTDPLLEPVVVDVTGTVTCQPEGTIAFSVPESLVGQIVEGCKLTLSVAIVFYDEAFLSGDALEQWSVAEGFEIVGCASHEGSFDPVPLPPGPEEE